MSSGGRCGVLSVTDVIIMDVGFTTLAHSTCDDYFVTLCHQEKDVRFS